MTLRYTDEERAAFLREHPELAYVSQRQQEFEMDIDDAVIALELAERYLPWLWVLLDPDAPAYLVDTAAQMIYLTGYFDHQTGRHL